MCSDDGFEPKRQQAIVWHQWRPNLQIQYPSLIHDELNSWDFCKEWECSLDLAFILIWTSSIAYLMVLLAMVNVDTFESAGHSWGIKWQCCIGVFIKIAQNIHCIFVTTGAPSKNWRLLKNLFWELPKCRGAIQYWIFEELSRTWIALLS